MMVTVEVRVKIRVSHLVLVLVEKLVAVRVHVIV